MFARDRSGGDDLGAADASLVFEMNRLRWARLQARESRDDLRRLAAELPLRVDVHLARLAGGSLDLRLDRRVLLVVAKDYMPIAAAGARKLDAAPLALLLPEWRCRPVPADLPAHIQ